MQNTHDLKEGTAEAGEFRNDENIVLVHTLNESAEFADRELLGAAYRLLNPAINGELLLIREFEDFKPLVFRGLFVG